MSNKKEVIWRGKESPLIGFVGGGQTDEDGDLMMMGAALQTPLLGLVAPLE